MPRAAARSNATTLGAPTALDSAMAAVLEISGTLVAADTPLLSAGLDSIAASGLGNALARRVDVELPQTLLFDHPTIRALESFIGTMTPTETTPTETTAPDKARGAPISMTEPAAVVVESRLGDALTNRVTLSSAQVCFTLAGRCVVPAGLKQLAMLS